MISYLKRHELDEDKYNSCIKLAVNSRIYAYSWYLDTVSDHWDVLVLNDYEAVMPLPWKSKYFIKYIYPPAWTQQLGVFSKCIIDDSLIQEFIHLIPKKFKKVTIQFNSGNGVSFKKTTARTNYILPLYKPYERLLSSFKNNRTYSINLAKRNDLTVKNCSFNELLKISNEKDAYKISKNAIESLKKLTEFIQKNDKGFLLGVYNAQGKLIGGAIFLKDLARISYLFSVVNIEGKKQQAASFLINEVICNYANSSFILDFEGSMISGIASFFKSFGAQKETYFLYQKPFQLF